ncbi:MAG: hypothetical protein HXS46_03315 [Theionarchaea archaeon]|nr:hypothetical protein [Theionarchaea archaeon]
MIAYGRGRSNKILFGLIRIHRIVLGGKPMNRVCLCISERNFGEKGASS